MKEKPICNHTKYVGCEPCICSQFENYWREQIAVEIEAKHSRFCQYEVQHFSEQGYNDFMPSRVEMFDKCSHLADANIARGKK